VSTITHSVRGKSHNGLALPAFTHVAMCGVAWADTAIAKYDIVAFHGVTTTGGSKYPKVGVAVAATDASTFTVNDGFRIAGICHTVVASGDTFIFVKAGKATGEMDSTGPAASGGRGIVLSTLTNGEADQYVGGSPGDAMKIFACSMENIATGTTGALFLYPWRG
jgi:hypothetical protein